MRESGTVDLWSGTRTRASYLCETAAVSTDRHRSLFEAVAVEPLGDGRYRGSIAPEWFGPPGPNGGYIAALMLRAIRAEIADDERLPRSLTLHYLLPPEEGEAEIEVTVERSGRSATTCSAQILQGGRVLNLGLCVLTYDFEPAKSWSLDPPPAPPFEEAEALAVVPEAPPIAHAVEIRPVFGSPPFSGGPEPVVGGWLRARGDDEMTPELIALYADAWLPAPFSMLETFVPAPTLELTIHFRSRPEPGDVRVLVRFEAEASIDGLFDERGAIWDTEGRLLAQSRQIALIRKPPPSKK
jgi:acyl-CoA thioesterase